jgi:phosphatidate cytidylyltransferase
VAQGAIVAHGKRVVSAVVLGRVALGAAYLGGPLFLLVWLIASIGILWEWNTLIGAVPRNTALAAGSAGLIAAAIALGFGAPGIALLCAAAGAGGVALLARPAGWVAGGVLYAAALFVPLVALREDAKLGLVAVLFLYAVVWATDVAALYAGRYFGGPKLAPTISPAKTWAGAIAGTLAGIAAGLVLLAVARLEVGLLHGVVALGVTVVGQLGDLFESWVKRQYGVKDASGIIPGHGGLMDRLDSFVGAVLVSTLFGALRGGADAPAQGLLQW